MSNEIPIVKEVKTKTFTTKQSKYKMVGALPSSMVCIGPSGSGKTTLLNALITDIYIVVRLKEFISSALPFL